MNVLNKIQIRINKNPRFLRIVSIVILAVVGTVTMILSYATTITSSIQPENGSVSGGAKIEYSQSASGGGYIKFGVGAMDGECGKRKANYTYQVPYGNALWNQSVCNLPRHERSADYASRFYNWGNINDGSPGAIDDLARRNNRLGISFGLDDITNSFSRTVYYARDATTRKQIQASAYESNLDGIKSAYSTDPDRLKFLPDTTIPWNPSWDTGHGGDNEIVVLDESTGLIYEISGYRKDPWQALGLCGPFFSDRLCTYTVDVGRSPNGETIDYRTYEGPLDGRGVGLGMYQTLTTPEEVEAGEIRHALGMAIPNTAYGPICSASQLGTANEGTTCGTALAPATKFEWGDVTAPPILNEPYKSIYTLSKTIPEGMRFALDMTEAQLDAWIASRPDLVSNPKKAKTAKIFARALIDYGVIVADTSGAGAGVQVAGSINPEAKQQWANLGIVQKDLDENLFQGLITPTNLYVVAPPTVKCQDGSLSKYYCRWTSGYY